LAIKSPNAALVGFSRPCVICISILLFFVAGILAGFCPEAVVVSIVDKIKNEKKRYLKFIMY